MASMKLPVQVRFEHLLILVGVILLVNPLYVGTLQLDQPNWYRYEASPVSFEKDDINTSIEAWPIDSDVACLNGNYRVCRLEYHVLQNNGVNYSADLAAGPGDGYRYTYINNEFYQVQPQRLGGNGTLSLQHLNQEKALRDISTALSRAPPKIRNAVRTGSVKTHQTLSGANELIRDGENYYVVHMVAYQVYGDSTYNQKKLTGQLIQYGLMIAGIVIGLWLVLRGQRERILRDVH